MSYTLPSNAAVSWPQPIEYRILRGWALERMMTYIFADNGWADLREWRPRKLAKHLMRLAEQDECPHTRGFLPHQPETALWLAGCLRVIFKCLQEDWDVRWVRPAPRLPVFSLPNEGYLDTGFPDLLAYSRRLRKFILIEIKSGGKPVKPNKVKIARYSAGCMAWIREHAPGGKLAGVVWLSFSSSKKDHATGNYKPRQLPVVDFEFSRFDEGQTCQKLDKYLPLAKLDTLLGLPLLSPPQYPFGLGASLG